jgi:hypothetical protein
MFQSWVILDQIETPNPGGGSLTRQRVAAVVRQASKILMFFARTVGSLPALEFVLTVTMRAIAQISFNRSDLQITANWRLKKAVNNRLSIASRKRRTKLYSLPKRII